MPSLEQLYSKSPLEQYSAMSLGAKMGIGSGGAGEYLARQQEYNRQIDELNRRVSEINPYIVEQQRLENQQKQYLMPTHQASGMEAQEKMKSGFYPAEVASKIAGFGKTQAEANLAAKTAQGQLPYAEDTAGAKAKTEMQVSKLDQAITAVNNFNTTDPDEAIKIIQQEAPESAGWLTRVIKTQGLEQARQLLLDMLQSQRDYLTTRDPKHQQRMQEIRAQIQGQKDIAGINAQAKSQAEKEFDAYIRHYKAAHPGASDYEAHSAFISARYQPSTTTYITGPDGKPQPIFTQQKGTPPAPTGAPAATPQIPKQIIFEGVKYDVIGQNQDGSLKVKHPKTGKTGTYRP